MRSLRRPNWRAVGIPPKQPDGPKLVKGQEAEALDRGAAILEPMLIFRIGDGELSDHSGASYGLVSRCTLEYADKLVAAVMQRLALRFHQPPVGLGKAVGMSDELPRAFVFQQSL